MLLDRLLRAWFACYSAAAGGVLAWLAAPVLLVGWLAGAAGRLVGGWVFWGARMAWDAWPGRIRRTRRRRGLVKTAVLRLLWLPRGVFGLLWTGGGLLILVVALGGYYREHPRACLGLGLCSLLERNTWILGAAGRWLLAYPRRAARDVRVAVAGIGRARAHRPQLMLAEDAHDHRPLLVPGTPE